MIAYESLMLGVFAIHRGPANELCSKLERQITDNSCSAHNRDRFPLASARSDGLLSGDWPKAGDWDRGYLHAAASLCTIVGDELDFDYGGGRARAPPPGRTCTAAAAWAWGCCVATASSRWMRERRTGTLVTRPITFRGKHLLVNVHAPNGELARARTAGRRRKGYRAVLHR